MSICASDSSVARSSVISSIGAIPFYSFFQIPVQFFMIYRVLNCDCLCRVCFRHQGEHQRCFPVSHISGRFVFSFLLHFLTSVLCSALFEWLHYNAYCASMQDRILHKYALQILCNPHNCASTHTDAIIICEVIEWAGKHRQNRKISG